LHESGLTLSLDRAREGAISGRQIAAGGADRFSHAYDALRHDPTVQFNLAPPEPPPTPPPWLKAFFEAIGRALEPVGRFLSWLGSFFPDAYYARIILWSVIALGVAILAWALVIRVRSGEWKLTMPRLANVEQAQAEEEWTPSQAGARAWLDEADALARDGRFAEAIHHLLFRSIEDLSRRRPMLVRPALTSRELAGAQGIPGRARELFTGIARSVERSLFGRRDVGEDEWRRAREAYSEFALAPAWRS